MALESSPHGAGREYSRSAARKQFTLSDLQEAMGGIEYRVTDAFIDEIPAAYKDIDRVMADASDLVRIRHTLRQIVHVKGIRYAALARVRTERLGPTFVLLTAPGMEVFHGPLPSDRLISNVDGDARIHAYGLRCRCDLPIRLGRHVARPDIAFTRLRVAIFIDGCFWHCCPIHGRQPRVNKEYWTPKLAKNVARDVLNTDALTGGGWTVLRYWEHEDADAVAADIRDHVATIRAARAPSP